MCIWCKDIVSGLLCLQARHLGDADIAVLSKCLTTNTTCHTLDLNINNIGVAGATALATMLKVNQTLINLGLCCNNFGDAGVVALSIALQLNCTLNMLFLTFNRIGVNDKGIAALSNALTVNTTLHTLDLNFNFISDAEAFRSVILNHNAAITTFSISRVRDTTFDADTQVLMKRNKAGKRRARDSAIATYKVMRLRLCISRDMSRLIAQYVQATTGHMAWVVVDEQRCD